jgi:hypothetical protein
MMLVILLLLLPAAVQALSTLHNSIFSKVKDTLNLKQTDFPNKYDSAAFTCNGFEGTSEWWDEVKGGKLTGVSKNVILNPSTGFSAYTLNCWMGPTYSCPHLLLTFGTDSLYNGITIRADFLPRGAVSLGSDQTVLDMHYGKDVLSWYDDAVKQSGGKFLAPSPSFSARLLRSPVELAVAGLSDKSVTDIATAHVTRWLTFVSEAKPNEPRSRGAVNTRDDKQRMFSYQAEVAQCVALVGSDLGPKLGAARTGPVAEAYVGGGG